MVLALEFPKIRGPSIEKVSKVLNTRTPKEWTPQFVAAVTWLLAYADHVFALLQTMARG